MKITPIKPPRKFAVGNGRITLSDTARIELDTDEQVTFTAPGGKEYDVVKKEWGFYATPSINHRLKSMGFRTALVKGQQNRYYIFLMEQDMKDLFEEYLISEGHTVVCWLDEEEDLKKLEKLFAK